MAQKPDLARDDRGALAQLRGDVVVGAERVGAVPLLGFHRNVLNDVATAGAERMVCGRMVASERHVRRERSFHWLRWSGMRGLERYGAQTPGFFGFLVSAANLAQTEVGEAVLWLLRGTVDG